MIIYAYTCNISYWYIIGVKLLVLHIVKRNVTERGSIWISRLKHVWIHSNSDWETLEWKLKTRNRLYISLHQYIYRTQHYSVICTTTYLILLEYWQFIFIPFYKWPLKTSCVPTTVHAEDQCFSLQSEIPLDHDWME